METISRRRSIRKFKSDPVEAEKITALLEAARLAPSGTNIQPWRFIAVTSPEMREKLSASTLKFVGLAPLVMICCADLAAGESRMVRINELKEAGAFAGTELETMSFGDYQAIARRDPDAERAHINLNAAIAIEHMILRGVELGLGSCWVFLFSRKKVAELFNLPENIQPLALVPFGYPDQDPPPRPRFPLEKIYLGEY